MAVIKCYHEVEYYRRKVIHRHLEFVETDEATPLDQILSKNKPPKICSFSEATIALQIELRVLTVLRDVWIRRL